MHSWSRSFVHSGTILAFLIRNLSHFTMYLYPHIACFALYGLNVESFLTVTGHHPAPSQPPSITLLDITLLDITHPSINHSDITLQEHYSPGYYHIPEHYPPGHYSHIRTLPTHTLPTWTSHTWILPT